MSERIYRVTVPASVRSVWDFHSSVEALKLLTPPEKKAVIVGKDMEVRVGALHIVRVKQFGIPMEWHARIVEADPPHRFVDIAERSPFASWWHEHAFLEVEGGTEIRDTLRYQAPGGPLAGLIDRLFVGKQLDALFAYRHQQSLKYFESVKAA